MASYDTIIHAMERGQRYTSAELASITHSEHTATAKLLGLAKRYNKVIRHDDKRWERINFEASTPESDLDEELTELMEREPSKRPETKPPSLSKVAPERPLAPIAKMDFTKPRANDVDAALVKIKQKLVTSDRLKNLQPPELLDTKLAALAELGKYLDPTIDKLFKSIASDLTTLDQLAGGGLNESA